MVDIPLVPPRNTNEFQDSKSNRLFLVDKENQRVYSMMRLLSSVYGSDIPSTLYAVFLKAIAREISKIELAGSLIQQDNYYVSTRPEFLWQILGHRLLDIDPKFYPTVTTDTEFRNFLLSLLQITLQGSKKTSMEEGVKLFTKTPVSVIELFPISQPLVPNSPFDVSDQWKWFFQIDGNHLAPGENMSLVLLGLDFIGHFLKPAHTLFDTRVMYEEDYDFGACCNVQINNQTVVFGRVIQRIRIIDQSVIGQFCNGVIVDDIAQIIPSRINFARSNISNLGVLTIILEGGVTIEVPADVVVLNEAGNPIPVTDLVVGDLVQITGEILNPILQNGFLIKTKTAPTAICEDSTVLYENYSIEDVRKCCDDQKVDETLIEDHSFEVRIGIESDFQLARLPLVDGSGKGRTIVESTMGLIRVLVDGNLVEVIGANPITGEIFIETPAPEGSTVQVQYYTIREPNYAIALDVVGVELDSWRNNRENFMLDPAVGKFALDKIVDVIEGEGRNQAIELHLNDPTRLMNTDKILNTDFTFTDIVVEKDFPVWEHESLCDTEEIEYNYTGFELAYSSILDDRWRLLLDTQTTTRNKLDDYNVVDSLGATKNIQLFGPPDLHFQRLASTQHLFVGVPLMVWTQDTINALNEVFRYKLIRFIPSFSDLMNSLNNFLNTNSLELGVAELEKIRFYLQDLYSCVIDFTQSTIMKGSKDDIQSVCFDENSVLIRLQEFVPPPQDILGICTERVDDTRIDCGRVG